MLNKLYKLIIKWMGKHPRQTTGVETKAVIELKKKYEKWGKK